MSEQISAWGPLKVCYRKHKDERHRSCSFAIHSTRQRWSLTPREHNKHNSNYGYCSLLLPCKITGECTSSEKPVNCSFPFTTLSATWSSLKTWKVLKLSWSRSFDVWLCQAAAWHWQLISLLPLWSCRKAAFEEEAGEPKCIWYQIWAWNPEENSQVSIRWTQSHVAMGNLMLETLSHLDKQTGKCCDKHYMTDLSCTRVSDTES